MKRIMLLVASGALAVSLTCVVAMVSAEEYAQAAFPGANGKLAIQRPAPPHYNYALYTINQDGTGLTLLTDFPNTHVSGPVWSPDGRKLVFHVEGAPLPDNPEGDFEIYAVNADGTGLTNLTNNASHEWAPTWSPDGKQIDFESERDRNREIYVMNADGSGQTRITHSSGSEHTPAWSPNGTRIAFERDEDIYISHFIEDRFQVAWNIVRVYAVIATNRRSVEAKISALSLGTEGGGSQWCTRLPEIMMISVADFLSLGRPSRGIERRESGAEGTFLRYDATPGADGAVDSSCGGLAGGEV
jgi:hypothetical protein